MSELPEGWANTKLGLICSKPQYGWTSKASREGRIKYVRTTDISGGEINWDEVPFCELEPDDIDKFRIREDDILVSRAGSVGVSLRIRDVPYDAVFASYLIRFNSLESTVPRYIEFFLRSRDYWRSISELSAGIAVPNVNASKLAELEIPLPPLNEQRRIVAKLEKLLSRVNAAQQRLATIPLILKRFRQAVLEAACSGMLTADWRKRQLKLENGTELLRRILNDRYLRWSDTNRTNKTAQYKQPAKADETSFPDLPTAWSIITIEALLRDDNSLSYGILKPGLYDPSGIPMLRVMDIGDGKLNDTEVFRVSPSLAEEYKRTKLEANDVLLAIMATIGRSMVVPSHLIGANVNRALAVLKLTELFDPHFACIVIRSPHFQDVFAAEKIGSAQLRINLGDLRQFTLPLPSQPEQQEIVRRVDALFKTADVLEARYRAAKAHVDKLTQSILAKAFRGELVPQDPNDEPASILLKRIRAAHALEENAPQKPRRTPLIKTRPTEVTMLKPEEIQHTHLSDILKDRGPLPPEALWKESQLDIDDFYDQLKLEETRGLLRETSNDASTASRLLEAA